MKTKSKIALNFILAFAVLVSCIAIVAADDWSESTADIKNMSVYVSDALVWEGSCAYNVTSALWDCSTTQVAIPAIERGEEIEVKTSFIAGSDNEKAKIETWISGYHNDIEEKTNVFDIYANNTYTKTLWLEIPADIEANDDYTLHVKIQQKNELSGIDTADITTKVQRATNLLEILSVDLYSASGKIEAGSILYVDVVVKNRGNNEAEDVYVGVSISELGLIKTVYLGDLGEDDGDDEDAEDVTIALPLPATAQGSYLLKIEAYNSKASADLVKNIVIIGEGAEPTDEGIVITPGTTMNSIEQGKGAVYTISVANFGSASQDFSIRTEGTEGWATVQIDPQTFNLDAGESETANIYVVANEDAIAAEHVFSVEISYGNTAEQCSLVANVVEEGSEAPELKTILIVIAVILAVVIIILLIVLLTRREAKETEETYY